MSSFSQKQESPDHAPIPDSKESSLESTLNLRAKYERAIRALNQTGVLELLPEKSALGIVGIDGKEYPMPEYEKLLEAVKDNEQLLKEKIEQGFDKLILVPLAIPLEVLILRYKQALKKHYQEKKLLGRNKETGKPEPLELDLNQPVFLWDEYRQADEKGTLVYHPRSFTKDHQGQTKPEFIARSQSSSFPGWQVILTPDIDIPKSGQGHIEAGRPEIEAGLSPEEYLKLLQTKPEYHQEEGYTPEDWLSYALTVLEERNEVIDDWQSKGSISYLTGAYFPASGSVPHAAWPRDDRQASLAGDGPGNRHEYYGARAAVRVSKS